MGDNSIIAPSRKQNILDINGNPTSRLATFFEKVADYLASDHDLMSNISDVTTADATDLASAIALANANKAKINEILAEMISAGIMNGP